MGVIGVVVGLIGSPRTKNWVPNRHFECCATDCADRYPGAVTGVEGVVARSRPNEDKIVGGHISRLPPGNCASPRLSTSRRTRSAFDGLPAWWSFGRMQKAGTARLFVRVVLLLGS